MNKDSRIYISGHTGLVGSALLERLQFEGYSNLIYAPHKELDLMKYDDVKYFLKTYKPEFIFHCAGRVGGIQANIKDPFGFLVENFIMSYNLIQCSLDIVHKFLNLGSSCVYPSNYLQPLKEEYILKDIPEKTNEGYSLSKICSLKMCEYLNKQYPDKTKFINLMPCNLYGNKSEIDLENSHVLEALLSKIVNAKVNNDTIVEIWGSGKQKREFMHVADLVDGMLWAMNNLEKTNTFLNIGTGEDITIEELSLTIANIVGYKGGFWFNTDKPDGMMKKVLDVSKINSMGWGATIKLEYGLKGVIDYYLDNKFEFNNQLKLFKDFEITEESKKVMFKDLENENI